MDEIEMNIKTYKYKATLSVTQTNLFDRWISLCKEAYNLLIEQRLAVKKFNDEQYYAFYPEKAEAKEKKDAEYKLKIDLLIESGKLKPKMKRPKSISPIRRRNPQLQEMDLDILTYVAGLAHVSQVEKFKNINQKSDKPLRLNVSWQSQSTFLTLLKTQFPEFSEVPSDLLAYTCKQVDQAFKKYDDNLRKYKSGQKFPLPPKFVSYRDDFSMTFMRDRGFKIESSNLDSKRVRVFGMPKVKDGIRIIYHKPVGGVVRQQAIIKEGGQYYLCLTFQGNKIHWPAKSESVGVDLGVARNVQLSDGSFKQLPIDRIKELEEKKKQIQRRLKRMELRSNNYYKVQARIAKIDKKIANIRKYNVVMFATEIARDHNVIVIEDLKIKNMTKSSKGDLETPGKMVAQKSGLNKSMLRVAPYMFRLSLETKAKEYGRSVIVVDPRYTSQKCSSCGHIDKESRKDQATYQCTRCGHEMNADHNAAINILKKAHENTSTSNK